MLSIAARVATGRSDVSSRRVTVDQCIHSRMLRSGRKIEDAGKFDGLRQPYVHGNGAPKILRKDDKPPANACPEGKSGYLDYAHHLTAKRTIAIHTCGRGQILRVCARTKRKYGIVRELFPSDFPFPQMRPRHPFFTDVYASDRLSFGLCGTGTAHESDLGSWRTPLLTR